MPLPSNGVAWPPTALAPITAKQSEFDAWYSGDPNKLASAYRSGNGVPFDTVSMDRMAQYRGGVSGAAARMWWGKPTGNLFTNTDADKLHVPLASDLCQASADLLYAEPPSLSAGKDKTLQKELDDAVERGLITTLAEGNEIGAALGDAYYRVTWDDTIADRAFITTVHADNAWPEFKWGKLVAVTFWWIVRADETTVVRHLERHELQGGRDSNGVIFHALYEGTRENLGRAVPLTEHTSTEDLADDINAEGFVDTESPGLAVVHVPNQRPQRRWRQHPIGSNLGRSDLDGIEPELDKLDMVWSSWMRDIRLAKARLIVPNFMLSSSGPGQGAIFDTDQDIYSTLNAPPREDGRSDITAQQFAIRTADHKATIDEIVGVVLQHSGYGEQTFGGQGDVAQTATEVDSRDRRSNLTRDRKIRAAQGPITELVRKLIAVNQHFFSAPGSPDAELEFKFAETTQANPLVLAQTSQALFNAQAASTRTRVAMMHPDWDDKAIDEEAGLILEEFGASVPDPFTEVPPGAKDPAVDDSELPPEADPANPEDQA